MNSKTGSLKLSTKLTTFLAQLTKKTHITITRNERGNITTYVTEMKRIIRDYYKKMVCQ